MTGLRGKNRSWTCVALSIAWSSVALLVIFSFPWPFEMLDHRIYDLKLSYLADATPNPSVVHVDIDDRAIETMGPWPWDRALSARIVQRLTELGAKVIVLDILYSTKGRSVEGDEEFVKCIQQSGKVVASVSPIAVSSASWPCSGGQRQEQGRSALLSGLASLPTEVFSTPSRVGIEELRLGSAAGDESRQISWTHQGHSRPGRRVQESATCHQVGRSRHSQPEPCCVSHLSPTGTGADTPHGSRQRRNRAPAGIVHHPCRLPCKSLDPLATDVGELSALLRPGLVQGCSGSCKRRPVQRQNCDCRGCMDRNYRHRG